MKKLLSLLITTIPFLLNAQIQMGIGAGINLKNTYPIVNTFIGYRTSIFSLDAEIRPAATRKANTNSLSGLKFGIDLLDRELTNASLIASVGYFYNLRSYDKTKLNRYQFGYSLKGVWYLKYQNGLFVEIFYSKEFQIGAGIHVALN